MPLTRLGVVLGATSQGTTRQLCLGFSNVPMFSTRRLHHRSTSRWIRFPPILDRKGDGNNHDEDEWLFRELYESQQNNKDDTKSYDQLAFFLEKNRSRERRMTALPQRGGYKQKPSKAVSPEVVVQHLLTFFSEVDDEDDIQDALLEAFQFTSMQDFDAIRANPGIRKSWKWGQPTENESVEVEKNSFSTDTTNRGSQQMYEGLEDAAFCKETEGFYGFLFGCDSFSFAGPPGEMLRWFLFLLGLNVFLCKAYFVFRSALSL